MIEKVTFKIPTRVFNGKLGIGVAKRRFITITITNYTKNRYMLAEIKSR